MFKIGERVTLKKTGIPTTATVVAISIAKITSIFNHTVWDKLYPNWRNKLVYTVQFDRPQKNIRFDEFSACTPRNWSDDEIKENYDKLPLYEYVLAPEDDITYLL